MKRTVLALATLAIGLPTASFSQESDTSAPTGDAGHPPVHGPARLHVRPLVRSYPGPDAVRQCTFWLATENRPSGTVIVPRQHCWWERG